ncbi:MAG: glycine--tRNA ligase subunit beta [Geminicoccaceae bacterium]|nr:MAG: glycine--tRNA ligase subunit beta [Geminicoccaceae bacterium]
MPELLVELLSEEIPARMQAAAAANLAEALRGALAARSIEVAADATTTFATPRRIGLVMAGLPAAEPKRSTRRRGPRVDAPEAAQAGFRRSLDGLDYALEEVAEKKGTFWVAIVDEGGAAIDTVLQATLEDLLPRFPWPKSMRWGTGGDARWVRPLQRMICLVDGAVVPVRFAGLVAGNTTVGHRFMAPAPLTVESAADHATKLQAAKVMLHPAERHRVIVEGARRLAAAEDLQPIDDPGLIDELVGLNEWPVPLFGRIDDVFMELPPEVLTTSMRTHQKYVALSDAAGRLAPRFVVVANLAASDGGAAIVAGNERVLRARLWDARYFWDVDRKQGLDGREPALEQMVFHASLGSMAGKARRLERLAEHLAHRLNLGEPAHAARAGRLAKADLVTQMVGEFPELQGIMGGYYARAMDEPEVVAAAIGGHYAPQGPNDRSPTAPTTVAVALADKLDSLAGFTAAGERATGSKDPLGLRRLALGILRLIFENDLRLPLKKAFAAALDGYGAALDHVDRVQVADDLMGFVADRLKVHLREDGLGADLIAAVFEAKPDDDVVRLRAKARAVADFLATADGADLLAAYRRARNIVRIEANKDGGPVAGEIDVDRLEDPAERALHAQLERVADEIEAALEAERYVEAMAALATLREAVDRFFEGVLVNAEDSAVRANRLRLLARLGGLLDGVAILDRLDEPRFAA